MTTAVSGRLFLYWAGPEGLRNGSNTREVISGVGPVVAGVGDVNGDGYGDFITGAAQAGTDNTGIAQLFLGNATGQPSSPSLTLTGPDTVQPAVVFSNVLNGDPKRLSMLPLIRLSTVRLARLQLSQGSLASSFDSSDSPNERCRLVSFQLFVRAALGSDRIFPLARLFDKLTGAALVHHRRLCEIWNSQC